MKQKPTIEELENILAADENAEIRINPDGSVDIEFKSDKEIIIELRRENKRLKEEVSKLGMVIYKIETVIKDRRSLNPGPE